MKNQARHARNFTKAALREGAGVQAREYFIQQARCAVLARRARAQHLRQQQRPLDRIGAKQLKPIVIDGNRKRARRTLRHAPGNQVGQSQMHMPPGKRVDKQVRAFTRLQHLGQQGVRCGQGRPLLLQLQQRPHALQLGRGVHAVRSECQLLHHAVGQRGRQRHAATTPARHGSTLAGAAPHPGGHVVNTHQLKQAATKHKTVAGFEPRDKTFFHTADFCAFQILHRHAGVADDGADVHAVTPRQPRIGHAPDTGIVGHGALVIRVSGKGRPALLHKRQAPVPAFAA